MPFIPDEPVTVSDHAEPSISLMWLAPRTPDRLFAHLCARHIADGWTMRSQDLALDVPAQQRIYEHGRTTRYIMISAGIVSLIQRPER